MTKKQKKELKKIIPALCLMALAFAGFFVLEKFGIPPTEAWWYKLTKLLVWIGIYLIVGFEIIVEAVKNVFSGHFLDENFLMMIASLGAFVLGEYEEGTAVAVFYCVGELFQSIAVGRSRRSIAHIAEMRVDIARVVKENGELIETNPEDVEIGSVCLVKPGEKIPLDGVVITGSADVNMACLTGESVPVSVYEGSEVFGGTINTNGTLKIRTTKNFTESSAEKIMELVENSTMSKSKTERFITRFAAVYTPIVVISAIILAVVPSIITGAWASWVKRALIFLVVSCPCALVISIPMAFFAGIGCASKNGILVKGADFIERLAKTETCVFDKTGTITDGSFSVVKVITEDKKRLFDVALTAESMSNHPIASAISLYCMENGGIMLEGVSDFKEIPGKGISLSINGKSIVVGNATSSEISWGNGESGFTSIYVTENGKLCGCFEISDNLKQGSKEAVKILGEAGIKKTVILSGDKRASVERVAKECNISRSFGELLPKDKVDKLSEIIAETKGTTVYVGDGINDAPVLALSDVGIAMGAMGQDAAIEAADAVIMNDDLKKLPEIIKISKKTVKIAKENIVFAIGIKVAVMILAVCGISIMWLAVFADVGVCVLAILNSMRALKK